MHKQLASFVAAALFMGAVPLIHAQPQSGAPAAPLSPNAQYEADSKNAKTRFNDDQKLCNADPDSASRMQCKRDAQTEYDKSVAAAKSRLAAAGGTPAPVHAACPECGTVVSVKQIEKRGQGSGLGMVAGGVLGGVRGHQVGGGVGKTLATVGGAAGGAYAGNTVEKNVKSSKVWTVSTSTAAPRATSLRTIQASRLAKASGTPAIPLCGPDSAEIQTGRPRALEEDPAVRAKGMIPSATKSGGAVPPFQG